MKSVRYIITLVVCTALLSCAGLKNKATEELRKIHTVAIVEIVADSTVGNFGNEEQKPSTLGSLGAMMSLAKGKSLAETAAAVSHPTENLLSSAVPILFANLKAVKAITVSDSSAVLNSPAYKATPAWALASRDQISSKGYKILQPNQPKQAQDLCQKLNVDGVMSVKIKFQKKMSTGVGLNGTATGAAEVVVTIMNREGKTVWNRSSNLYDPKAGTVGIVDGVYDKEKMDPLILAAFNETTKYLFSNTLKKEMEVAK
mgnify:CR=1 FL=1